MRQVPLAGVGKAREPQLCKNVRGQSHSDQNQ